MLCAGAEYDGVTREEDGSLVFVVSKDGGAAHGGSDEMATLKDLLAPAPTAASAGQPRAPLWISANHAALSRGGGGGGGGRGDGARGVKATFACAWGDGHRLVGCP